MKNNLAGIIEKIEGGGSNTKFQKLGKFRKGSAALAIRTGMI